jgi:hypothetical protein
MTMTRSGVKDRFHNITPRPNPGPPKGDVNARASDSDIRRMTGGSGPASAPGHHHVHHSVHGDHRQANFHTGSANTSAVPHVQPGGPPLRPSSGNNSGGHYSGHDT